MNLPFSSSFSFLSAYAVNVKVHSCTTPRSCELWNNNKAHIQESNDNDQHAEENANTFKHC